MSYWWFASRDGMRNTLAAATGFDGWPVSVGGYPVVPQSTWKKCHGPQIDPSILSEERHRNLLVVDVAHRLEQHLGC